MTSENPILNSPYNEPLLHYATDADGALNYQDIRQGRRVFTPDIQVIPSKQGPQASVFEVNDFADEYADHLINLCRKEVGKWRSEKYPNTMSLITKSVPPICTKSVPLYFVNFSGSKPEATCTEWTFTSPLKPY